MLAARVPRRRTKMNGPMLHLAFNHVPVIGVPFCALLLLAGLVRRSRELVSAALVAFVLVALLTIVAYLSGDPAQHVAQGLPGVERDRIEQHSDAADWAFWAVEALGIAALVGLYLGHHKG